MLLINGAGHLSNIIHLVYRDDSWNAGQHPMTTPSDQEQHKAATAMVL